MYDLSPINKVPPIQKLLSICKVLLVIGIELRTGTSGTEHKGSYLCGLQP